MSHEPARHPLQQRVADTILDAAARVLAERGEHASMLDVANAAGVARATLYRYFPARQALLDELARVAVDDASARLDAARVHEVDPEEGLRRAVRALVEVGDPFVVARGVDSEQFERRLAAPLRRLLERAQAGRIVRADLSSAWLADSLVALVVSTRRSQPALGREDAVAAITSVFLDGARVQSA